MSYPLEKLPCSHDSNLFRAKLDLYEALEVAALLAED
jgi:hypothetical protein